MQIYYYCSLSTTVSDLYRSKPVCLCVVVFLCVSSCHQQTPPWGCGLDCQSQSDIAHAHTVWCLSPSLKRSGSYAWPNTSIIFHQRNLVWCILRMWVCVHQSSKLALLKFTRNSDTCQFGCVTKHSVVLTPFFHCTEYTEWGFFSSSLPCRCSVSYRHIHNVWVTATAILWYNNTGDKQICSMTDILTCHIWAQGCLRTMMAQFNWGVPMGHITEPKCAISGSMRRYTVFSTGRL